MKNYKAGLFLAGKARENSPDGPVHVGVNRADRHATTRALSYLEKTMCKVGPTKSGVAFEDLPTFSPAPSDSMSVITT